jgi:hypothetical protein
VSEGNDTDHERDDDGLLPLLTHALAPSPHVRPSISPATTRARTRLFLSVWIEVRYSGV